MGETKKYRRFNWTTEKELQLAELFHQMLPPSKIAEALGVTAASVDSRARKLGLTRPKKHPSYIVPDDFEERAKTMNVTQLARFYERSRETIAKWFKIKDIPCDENLAKRGKAIPKSFETIARNVTRADLAKFYNCDLRTIRGWLEETKIIPLTPEEKRMRQPVKAADIIKPKVVEPRREFKSREKLVAAEAAHFLRRTHLNVHRADIQMYENSSHTWGDVHEIPHRGINQYFVSGKGVMWLDDLVAYAETKGFKVKELI